MSLVRISRELCRRVEAMRFGEPVAYVYNPLVYARDNHEAFLKRYGRPGIEALLVGMNPGPFGMAQTGVPFGEVELVRDWLGIEGPVDKPPKEHPKRPVVGFDCTRSEVSGRRVWGWAAQRFGTPERFFQRFFVWNHCPLVFMEETGRNRTPDKLPAVERDALMAACDAALRKVIRYLGPRRVIGVGAYGEQRARQALGETDVSIGRILHPSPASPLANKGWAPQAEKQLLAMGVALG